MRQHDPIGEAGTVAGDAPDASIPRPSAAGWQAQLAGAIRDPAELWRILALPPDLLPAARRAAAAFPLLVPRGFAALMRPGDPSDPLLRQVLPIADELAVRPGWTADPLHEADCSLAPGLLRKYRSRALMVATGACAVHCRYCFRRHFPYDDGPRGRAWWAPALAAIAAEPEIDELILSGGDPLTLPDAQLAAIARDAAAIPHLARLRVHTRLPVVLPDRVDPGLLAALSGTRLGLVVVIHANHARELSPAVAGACTRLRGAGATVLNQSVLLAGVNDGAEVLIGLSRRLSAIGVLPYYLHQLDRVAGAGHFAVEDARALALLAEVHAALPGYLVPRLVREEPGAPGKTLLGPS